jgi:hypothetical protein
MMTITTSNSTSVNPLSNLQIDRNLRDARHATNASDAHEARKAHRGETASDSETVRSHIAGTRSLAEKTNLAKSVKLLFSGRNFEFAANTGAAQVRLREALNRPCRSRAGLQYTNCNQPDKTPPIKQTVYHAIIGIAGFE